MNGARIILAFVFCLHTSVCLRAAAAAEGTPGTITNRMAFQPDGAGGFLFDTGVLRGTLHGAGRSLGLTNVIHVPSGRRLDRSNGLLSHYRVFSKGTRYGGGAWDWPSQARLLPDGAAEVVWAPSLGRPFVMRAFYRLTAANTIDVTTEVEPQKPLAGFEAFLASYFDSSFTNAAVCTQGPVTQGQRPVFVPIEPRFGPWQIFPRLESFRGLIEDGRWQLAPNPVEWRIRTPFALPLVCRRAAGSGITAALMAPSTDCFAIASPEQTEAHYSLYLSLFGRELEAGQPARARARLVVGTKLSDASLLQFYDEYAR